MRSTIKCKLWLCKFRLQILVNVEVNDYLVAYPQTPFGGYKDSGIAYEIGLQAIGHYTRIKSVTVNTS